VSTHKGKVKTMKFFDQFFKKLPIIKKQNSVVRIYRYYRFLHPYQSSISPKGGLTFYIEIDYKKNEIHYSCAVCSKKDNFNKKLGQTIARNKFDYLNKFRTVSFENVIPSYGTLSYIFVKEGIDEFMSDDEIAEIFKNYFS